ncbi:glycosyltransferase [Maribellus sediminis]|uniref:glycosyltransferase n=1 Tax=Maribellus sediminis TaxID=2696285 RepID=UPI0014306CD7|nr:glycosyltransferase [Maribellus sediminis]
MTKPLVTICCITFNHRDYISETIEGFLIQKTTVPIKIIIHDDASTDGTPEIIKAYEQEYPDIITAIYQKENQYSKGIKPLYNYVYPKVDSKYIASCEGDDYWTDPYKLQKQVEFLEANPEYGLVYTEFDRLNQKTGIIETNVFNSVLGYKENSFEDFLINVWYIGTLTWVFRRSFLPLAYEYQDKNFIIGDLPLLLTISANSKVGFLKESTAVYRVLEKSASHSKDWKFNYKFRQNVYKIQQYFIDRYNVSDEIKLAVDLKYFETIFIRSVLWGDKALSKKAYQVLLKHKNLSLTYILFYHIAHIGFLRKWLKKYYYQKIWKRS